MDDKKLIVKDAVTENELVSRFSEFIGKDTFSSLASCATIVGLLVQLVKSITAIPPLALSFIFSAVVSGLKLILSGDYTRQNIVLAVINILPIALTASGGYDVLKNISQWCKMKSGCWAWSVAYNTHQNIIFNYTKLEFCITQGRS